MKWLITGASGMVGSAAREQLSAAGEDLAAFSRRDLDISDSDAVNAAIDRVRPDVIFNCAAYTKVDDCETNEAVATANNASAVETLAAAANRTGALLAHISTDFVFDGSKRTPYEINDATAPLSAYGRSKLGGEHAASHAKKNLVVRTAWVFGRGGWNFVEAIRKQIDGGKRELRVVNDQRGRPTYAPHLASAMIRLARRAAVDEAARGMFHYSDQPECTWFDFAVAIAEELLARGGPEVRILPVASTEFVRPAVRPSYSVLSTERYERVTGVAPDSWREGLAEYLR